MTVSVLSCQFQGSLSVAKKKRRVDEKWRGTRRRMGAAEPGSDEGDPRCKLPSLPFTYLHKLGT